MSRKIYPYDEHVLDTLGATFVERSDPCWAVVKWDNRPASPRTRAVKKIEFLNRQLQTETTEAGREAIAEARVAALRNMEDDNGRT